MRVAVVLPCLLTIILSGCAGPFPGGVLAPHFVRTQPEVDGVLLTAGVPRAGVQVMACQGLSETGVALSPRRCDAIALSTTDAQGRFHFESHGYVETAPVPLGDRSTYEILGVDTGGRDLVWHQVWERPAPERLSLSCELADRLVCKESQVH